MKNEDFKEIYERNADTVYRICMLRLKSPCDAEDAVQSVFLNFLKKPRDFADREQEKAFFIVAARNQCKDFFRHWWNSKRTDAENIPESACQPENDSSELLEKLMSLPHKYKEILYLYYYEGYSVKEISELTGTNESTLRTRLCKGRERLKKMLETPKKAERSFGYERKKDSGSL